NSARAARTGASASAAAWSRPPTRRAPSRASRSISLFAHPPALASTKTLNSRRGSGAFGAGGAAAGGSGGGAQGKLRVHGAFSGSGLPEQTPARVGPSCCFRTRIPGIRGHRAPHAREAASGRATDLPLPQAVAAQPVLEREQLHPI